MANVRRRSTRNLDLRLGVRAVAIGTGIAWVSLVLASGLLITTGAMKILAPAGSEPLLAVLRIPVTFRSGRALGVVELSLGSAALLTADSDLIATEAVVFTIFAAILAYILAARVPLSSCGCAGSRETPPSLLHVGLDLVAAGATTFAAIERPPMLVTMWPKLDLLGVPFVIGVGTALVLWLVAMGPLAELVQGCARIRAAGLVYQHPDTSEVAQ